MKTTQDFLENKDLKLTEEQFQAVQDAMVEFAESVLEEYDSECEDQLDRARTKVQSKLQ